MNADQVLGWVKGREVELCASLEGVGEASDPRTEGRGLSSASERLLVVRGPPLAMAAACPPPVLCPRLR